MDNQDHYPDKSESKLAFSLRSNGYLFPVSIEQVRILEENHPLVFQHMPSNISSAADILKRGIMSIESAFSVQINAEIQNNLAQAAREGKEISDEVRQQMIRDRQTARKQKGNP